jgi:DNA-binding NarL/FixJ family response regulator
VLLVDDCASALSALGNLLGFYGHLRIAGQAENGRDGLALAERLQPDLVITDLDMPTLNGLQLVELLRQRHPTIKSIIISALDCPAFEATSLRHGADGFIAKQRLAGELPHLLSRLFPDHPEPGL